MGEGVVVQNVDVRKLFAGSWRPSSPIVYLAGFHDWPGFYELGVQEKLEWQQAAREIMVDIPLKLVDGGCRLIYYSSMRALTHTDTFYGNLKRTAESRLFPHATLLRFGTVWGQLDVEKYNRTITVPNNWAIRRELPDENWFAYLTPMHEILKVTETALEINPPFVYNVVQPGRPCVAKDLHDWVPPLSPVPEELIEKETHPALLTADYYNLPMEGV
jgi:hypothetical protein